MSERYEFGDFVFDSTSGTLTRKGVRVKLQAQPASVLRKLLAHHDRVVSREEMKQTLWANDTFVDFDKGLNFCVGQVRRALRDKAARSLYIRTVPKEGYQFIAPVRVVPAIPTEESTPPPRGRDVDSPALISPSGWTRFSFRSVLVMSAVTIILAFARWGYWAATRTHAEPVLAVLLFQADPGQPELQILANHLTDNVVVQLTGAGGRHYRVIGNAAVLRKPGEQRNLPEVASALHCSYAVLGQVQAEGGRILILAHLIRLSDLTHICVVRFGPASGDPLILETEAANRIAAEFATAMAKNPDRAPSFVAASL